MQVVIRKPCHVDGIKRQVGAHVEVTPTQASGLIAAGYAVDAAGEVETAATEGGPENAADTRPRGRRG